MLKRPKKFLESKKIIFEHQYGFQKKKSTVLAVLDLLNNIVDAFENKSYSAVIFLDFTKAFDTVNYDILIDKIELYCVRVTALSWFKPYLLNRKHVVNINGVLSSEP